MGNDERGGGGIKDAEAIFLFADDSEVVPAQDVVEGEPAVHFPTVLDVEAVVVLEGIAVGEPDGCTSTGDIAGDEIGESRFDDVAVGVEGGGKAEFAAVV